MKFGLKSALMGLMFAAPAFADDVPQNLQSGWDQDGRRYEIHRCGSGGEYVECQVGPADSEIVDLDIAEVMPPYTCSLGTYGFKNQGWHGSVIYVVEGSKCDAFFKVYFAD